MEQLIAPIALAVAVGEVASEYYQAVRSGKKPAPAYRRPDDGIIAIWRDTRLEALGQMQGAGNAVHLADIQHQSKLLELILSNRNEQIYAVPDRHLVDAVSGLWNVYTYLGKIGIEVCDRETCDTLGENIVLKRFLSRADELRREWNNFDRAVEDPNRPPLPLIPKTVFEILYDDVTLKSKSIALSSKLGPEYHATVAMLIRNISSSGQDPGEFKTTFDRIMKASDPDHLSDLAKA